MAYITKNDYVYQEIKRAILKKAYHDGERLVVSDLVKKYGVSPMPIREALTRLAHENYIELIPHVGAKVISFNQDQYKEIQQIRVELEVIATKLLAPVITDNQIAALETLMKEGNVFLRENTPINYTRWNKKFHLLVAEMNPNRALEEYIKNEWAKMEIVVSKSLMEKWRVLESYHEHEQWYAALKARDSEKAESACRIHCSAVAGTDLGDSLL
jgi:DNA-binding GntR family transcriptional regulator